MRLRGSVRDRNRIGFASGGTPDPGPFPSFAPLFWRAAAADPANSATAIDQTFAPSDVDIANGKINLPDLVLGAPGTVPQAAGVWIYFGTDGVLPAPLLPLTPYYASPASGGGYKIFPVVSGNDWQNIPGAIADEDQGPAQNYQQQVNAVVFTTQGSGTHRIYSDPLAAQIADLSGNGYHAVPPVTGNKNFYSEIPLDTDGRPYFRSRVTTRDQSLSSYVMHGKNWRVPNAARTKLYGARSVVHIATLTFRNRDWKSLSKWQQASTTFNTSTGIITRSSHGWSTGFMVKFFPQPGSTMPAGFTANTAYYCRSVSSSTLTMHPTATDATNNTNVIIPTDQGSGTITMVAVQYPGDIERYRQLIEHYRPADATKNALTVFTDDGTGSSQRLDITTRFYPSANASTNCRMGGAGVTPNRFTAPDYAVPFPHRLQIPAESVGPTCDDTGLPLTSGTYWTTAEPGATAYLRYHRSKADADFCQGLSNTACGNRVIRFTAAGSGWFLWETADGKAKLQSFLDAAIPDLNRIPIGQKLVLAVVVDMNDPASVGARIKAYVNGALFADVDCDGTSGRPNATKGVFASTSDPSIAATIFNSTQGHVALEADVYDLIMGASTGVIIDTDFKPVTDWMMAKYNVIV